MIIHHAKRALRRLLAPIREAHAVGADLDAGFDAGEWSRGWHDEEQEAEEAVIARRVAHRFKVDVSHLQAMERNEP
jgi:hypothetical protein